MVKFIVTGVAPFYVNVVRESFEQCDNSRCPNCPGVGHSKIVAVSLAKFESYVEASALADVLMMDLEMVVTSRIGELL